MERITEADFPFIEDNARLRGKSPRRPAVAAEHDPGGT